MKTLIACIVMEPIFFVYRLRCVWLMRSKRYKSLYEGETFSELWKLSTTWGIAHIGTHPPAELVAMISKLQAEELMWGPEW